MKFALFFICAGLFVSCATARIPAPPQTNVFALNASTLTASKRKIDNKDAAYIPAYKQLLKDADKALTQGPFTVMDKKNNPPSGDKHDYMSLAPYFWPDPSKPDGLPYIRKDGQTNPEVKDYSDKDYMPRLCELVSTLGLAYYFSGDECYADHAATLLKVWFLNADTKMNPNLNFAQSIKGQNDGRGAGLIDTRHFVKLIDGIGLLQGSKSWKAEDQKGMQKWFADFLNWMQTSPNGVSELKAENNHGTWYDAQRMSMALFTGNTELAKSIYDNVVKRLDEQMDAEGKFPKEMVRTIALHYNLFDLEAFYWLANMSEKIGKDLWSVTTPKNNSLKKGFDFLHPYLTKEKKWEGQQIKPFEFEEGYPVLLMSAKKYNCKDCVAAVNTMEGDAAAKNRYNLLY